LGRKIIVKALVTFTDIPDFEASILSGGGHIPATSREGQCCHWGREMGQDLDHGLRGHIGSPHEHLTIDMTGAQDSILLVLPHACGLSLACFALGYLLTAGDVQVLDETKFRGSS
jgi:hypothetical protein